MAQTAAQRRIVARILAAEMFGRLNATATLNLDHLVAVIDYIDTKMDANASTLTQNQSVKANFIQNMPEPFRTQSTAAQKGLAMAYWALMEGGLL